MDYRKALRDKKKIVIKVGSSTITYAETGAINLAKLEKFVRILINIRNQGKEVIVVSSGAIGVGRKALGLKERPQAKALRQACAAVGQGRLMMMYEKLFSEYNQQTAQVLLTKETLLNEECARSARETFDEILARNIIPVVNENDAVSVDEQFYGMFGDNDTMSAEVAALLDADLLILMSDIDGLYTDDPRENPAARFVHTVGRIDEELEGMAKGAGTDLGTGGMATKITAAKIATEAGVDMVIANGENIYTINDVLAGKKIGTLFLSKNSGYTGENELAPEKEQFRRQAKRKRKEAVKEKNHGIQ